jgi:cytochrome c biogenesis protein ResB
VKNFLKALKSMKLAVVLLAYLAVAGLLATLVPQGRELAWYQSRHGRLLSLLIVESGFSHFFTSLMFLLPSFLFFCNLSVCAVDRFLRELKKKAGRRHGPDMLHLGLMLLVVGSVLSFSGRQDGSIDLAVGDGVELPDGRIMKLSGFEYLKYDDGRPKDWISTVEVLKDGKAEIASYPIKVNHPLKLGAITIYQVSHSAQRILVLLDATGAERKLGQGAEISGGGSKLSFMAVDKATGAAILRLVEAGGKSAVLRAAPGDRVGAFTVGGLRDLDLSGLEAVKDPGFSLVLAALILTATGIFLTFIQKLGDMKP